MLTMLNRFEIMKDVIKFTLEGVWVMENLKKHIGIKFVGLIMLIFVVSGISIFIFSGCSDDGENCFFVEGLLGLGLADDTPDCVSLAADFDCDDFSFDAATGECDGIDCTVCDDGGCDLFFETANDVDCDFLQAQFGCDDSGFAGGNCGLVDCNFCEP